MFTIIDDWGFAIKLCFCEILFLLSAFNQF